MIDLRDVPRAHQAEHAVLGCLLLEGAKTVGRLAEGLTAQDFDLQNNQLIFATMLRLHKAGRGVDLITVSEALRAAGELELAGGPAHLALLMEEASIGGAYVDDYACDVRGAATRRELLRYAVDLEAAASNGCATPTLMDRARAGLDNIARRAAPTPGQTEGLGVGLGAFFGRTFADPEPYITDLLSSDGSGFLGGEEKTYKTWYALAEALALALGHPVLGRFDVPAARRVLFVEEEDPPRRTWIRTRALFRGYGYDPDDPLFVQTLNEWFRLSVWEGVTLDDPAMLRRLDATIASFKPHVVYLDVLRKLTLKDLNKAQEAGVLLATLDDFRRRHGALFRVVHHFRKAQGFRTGRGSQELGGSFVLGAWIESGLSFEAVGRKDGHVRVTPQNKDSEPVKPFRIKLETEGPRHAPTLARLSAIEEADAPDADEVVYQAVAALPTQDAVTGKPGVSRQQIRDHLKRSEPTIRRSLDRLEAVGRVLVTGSMTNRRKLYGIKANEIAGNGFVTSPESTA